MFLVEDKPCGNLVFTWEDPRKAGYTGQVVEGVDLDYRMEVVHDWPEGDPRPEPRVGRNPQNPKFFKVFKYNSQRESAGYQPVDGTAVVFGSWSDYLRSRHPDLLEDEQWYRYLDELDEASRRRRHRTQPPDPPADSSRDEVAAWVAREHLLVDSSIREVWYLPQAAPPDEIRLLEINDRLAPPESSIEAIDFGLDVGGVSFSLFVADVTSEQLDQINKDPSRLPPEWSLDAKRIWRRGA